uniref:THAP-type domain-containing protein n=1 Tax=Stomoxys calcitrans TaxID=35570 RepID=A0A1I8P5G6_STOCA
MGGCRCCFRDCQANSTKCEGMHFFRFPLKDPERFKKWREYCKQEGILQNPQKKQKNYVICGRHFRDECFMNYKKDRLTNTAVPTIHRLRVDKALDYELDIENGVLVTIEPPQQKHLIPPPGLDTLCLENDEQLWEKLNAIERQGGDEESLLEEMVDFSQDDVSSSNINAENVHFLSSHSKRYHDSSPEDIDLECGPPKKMKICNLQSNVAIIETADQTDSSPEAMIQLESFQSNFPKIINHQIIEPDCTPTVINKESYNITDNGNDYELIEIQNDKIVLKSCVRKKQKEDEVASTYASCGISPQRQTSKLQLMEKANEELQEQKTYLENTLHSRLKENDEKSKEINNLKSQNVQLRNEIELLKKQLRGAQLSGTDVKSLRESYEEQLKTETRRNTIAEQKFADQIGILKSNLEIARLKLSEAKTSLKNAKEECTRALDRNENLVKQQVETDNKLQNLQKLYEDKDVEHQLLAANYETLQIKHIDLQKNYKRLQNQQDQQVAMATTTNKNNNNPSNDHPKSSTTSAVSFATNTLSKAQLFNGIKRYVSSSMTALLRMEMFGSSEREWKTDERQVAVDLLCLGESVYEYFTDEWRLRLPGIRDVRDWSNQASNMDDEEVL